MIAGGFATLGDVDYLSLTKFKFVFEQVRKQIGVKFRFVAIVFFGEQGGNFASHNHFQRAVGLVNPFEQPFADFG